MLLITGCTGHSGGYLLHELSNNNYNETIRCIVRESSNTSLLDSIDLKIDKVIGDLSDSSFVEESMIGIDIVMHIGSIFHSITVMNAAVKCNVKKVILVHTTGIYSKYKSASEDYKRIEERVVEIVANTQVGVIYLRPTMIYGNITDLNMSKFIKMVDKLRIFPIINHGSSKIQPVNARDLGRAYYQVLNNPSIINGDYILSGERPITMLDTLKMISDQLGKKTLFISFPLSFSIILARLLKMATIGKIDLVEKVQRMGEDRSFLHHDAIRDFGYKPMSFNHGMSIEVEQYLSASRK